MIVDPLGRRFKNLRVSLTAACNYACTYCVPDGKKLQALSAELSEEELNSAVRLLVEAGGIDRLRITGGEPLISPKFDSLLDSLNKLSLTDIAITTNGQFLKKKLPVIQRAGITRLNVSLDTLDHKAFRSIARSGDLTTVLEGIEEALELGIKVKVNCVPIRTANLDQLLPILEYCIERKIELRYIELMNMGHLKHNQSYEQDFIGMDEILEKIGARYEYYKIDAPLDSTSVRFEISGFGRFGIIANESEPFCRTCTRLRLSSNGQIFGCLSNSKAYPIRNLLDKSYPTAISELQTVLRSAMQLKQRLAFTGETTVMKFIGG
ncbi:MAG: radical SAM protein [Gammaproteobacteria bacterium]|nr:radical SAM protein [Gammaproteobacteria bacterium]MYI76923.1 radical SAM protein [Gammaproteobacteria bacterium]